jgi:Spy/CpxP family protein refolding chaperone
MKIGWRGITGMLAVLIIGLVLGIVLDRAMLAHSHAPTDNGREAEHHQFVERLRSDLGLTETQLREVESVLYQQQAAVDSAWLHIRGHLHNSVDTVRSAIERVLTPEQRREFSAWWAQFRPTGDGLPETSGNHN